MTPGRNLPAGVRASWTEEVRAARGRSYHQYSTLLLRQPTGRKWREIAESEKVEMLRLMSLVEGKTEREKERATAARK